MDIKTDFSVGIIIFNKKQKKFLIIKQINEIWGFPKGHPNKNETLFLAAKRELLEETGIDLNKLLINNRNIFFDKFLFKIKYEFISKNILIKKDVCFFLLVTNDFDAEKIEINIDEKEIMKYCFADEIEAKKLFNFSETSELLDRVILFMKNYKIFS